MFYTPVFGLALRAKFVQYVEMALVGIQRTYDGRRDPTDI
jgi:hypothetical protein